MDKEIVSFCQVEIEICPKRNVEWKLPKIEYFLVLGNGVEFDFGACEQSGTTMGIQPKINHFSNVNYTPSSLIYTACIPSKIPVFNYHFVVKRVVDESLTAFIVAYSVQLLRYFQQASRLPPFLWLRLLYLIYFFCPIYRTEKVRAGDIFEQCSNFKLYKHYT